MIGLQPGLAGFPTPASHPRRSGGAGRESSPQRYADGCRGGTAQARIVLANLAERPVYRLLYEVGFRNRRRPGDERASEKHPSGRRLAMPRQNGHARDPRFCSLGLAGGHWWAFWRRPVCADA
jgi:hypothetical protein